MAEIAELRAARAAKVAEFTALADRMNVDDYAEQPADQTAYDGLKKDIAAFDAKIARANEADIAKGALLVPIGDTKSNTPFPLKRYAKLRAYKDYEFGGVQVRGQEQAYRVGQFIMASILGRPSAVQYCREHGIAMKAATQAENQNATGGFLIPEEMMDSIIDLREQYGVFRANCQIVPMMRDTLNWPRRTGGVTAYFPGEGAAPTQSAATWDSVNLTAKKMAALVLLSTELAEDAIINIADWITQEIAWAFASKEDDCGFSGDGTSTYAGMTGLANKFSGSKGNYTATSHQTADALTSVDLESMVGLLPQYAIKGGNVKWYCSQYFFALLFSRLAAAAGGNTINTLSGEVQYQYLGFPIAISQKLPSTTPTGTVALYFGDMAKACAFGERREITIKRSDDRYFDTDQVGILGTERFDINCHDVGSSTVAGPLVCLTMG